MLGRLGGLIGHHPWVALLVWLALAGSGFALANGALGNQSLFERLTSGEPTVPGEALTAQELVEDASDTGAVLTGLVEGVDLADEEVATTVTGLVADAREDLTAVDGVRSVADPFAFPPEDPRAGAYLSTDGDAFVVVVVPDEDVAVDDVEVAVARLDALVEDVAAEVPGATGGVGGVDQLVEAITAQVEDDLRSGELIALPLSLAVMVFVFGGFLAAGIPIVGAVASVAAALASLLGFSYLIDIDSSVVSILSVLGLGLSIDYGLLIVSRYREEARRPLDELPPERQVPGRRHRHSGREQRVDALRRTMSTAGRTVMFSGITVALSLSGLLLFEASILRAVGAAGLSVVVVALLVALTLVPALLALGGDRLLRPGLLRRIPGLRRVSTAFGDVAPPTGFFSALAGWTQRRPWLVAAAVTAVLGLLTVPALDMQLRSSGIELLPVGHPQRELFETLGEDFPALSAAEATVVVRSTDEAVVADLRGDVFLGRAGADQFGQHLGAAQDHAERVLQVVRHGAQNFVLEAVGALQPQPLRRKAAVGLHQRAGALGDAVFELGVGLVQLPVEDDVVERDRQPARENLDQRAVGVGELALRLQQHDHLAAAAGAQIEHAAVVGELVLAALEGGFHHLAQIRIERL